jgi:3-oxoacyl-[acyl-carrier protein] reductase
MNSNKSQTSAGLWETPLKLKNKVAIVTGGGRGIGKAIAIAFAREGAKVTIISRTISELEETRFQICTSGGEVFSLQADVSKREDVETMVTSVTQHFGSIDILVNNAGIIGPVGPLANSDVSNWIETINVNLIGTFLCCKAVLPFMVQQHSGKIINLSGGGATSPRPMFSAYAASKCGIVGLTNTLAEETKNFNIQVNAISPGAVYSRMHEQILKSGSAASEKELEASRRIRGNAQKNFQAPAELAVFLASAESDGLTGRLISACWDNWKSFGKKGIKDIMAKDLYAVRRIDGMFFFPRLNQ